jgi:hydrogenase maturation protein HypF
VGFRPFVYALARRLDLTGIVRNDSQGVHIEVEGPGEDLDRFLSALRDEAPPLAVVESVTWQVGIPSNRRTFRILGSRKGDAARTLVSSDVAVCADCLREMWDPADRRYRYPFTNCTNCGPRFTITRSVPYDRAMTTMAAFPMCPACRAEYDDPANRRFHAQPNACPECGPSVQLLDAAGRSISTAGNDPIQVAAGQLRSGSIVAVKGLGGFHLACDLRNEPAVAQLRERKHRQDKPFAVMVRDLEEARSLCEVSEEEATLLLSPARPIVLLTPRIGSEVAADVAPGQKTLGVMLAYTPLHHLLLHDAGGPLVMTSGNRTDEPIAYRDDEAVAQLAGIADYFLVHNRAIHMRCDDSVTRVVEGRPYPLRRSRGYAPTPLSMTYPFAMPILACGGELKNTFCMARGRHAFLSHHIGDLENYETLRSFCEGIEHYRALFDVRPEGIAYDLHPEYLSTKYAREREEEGFPTAGIQHHHAHIAACLADNERPVDERVIGVALDGTGYGTDGAIWGGEFLTGSIAGGFERRGHLEYVPMPGGAAAIRQPWRMAVAYLIAAYGDRVPWDFLLDLLRSVDERDINTVVGIIRADLHSPPTSSTGRLFDAVAALLGLPGSMQTTYEGQAAIGLEAVAHTGPATGYPIQLSVEEAGWVVQTSPIITGIVDDLLTGTPVEEIAARFHATVADGVIAGCRRIRETDGLQTVALSGGTFQNTLLLHRVVHGLRMIGITVYLHHRVPANDGGLSLGQAVLADSIFRQAKELGTHTCA